MTGAYTALCPEEINLGKRPQSHLLHGEFGSWHVSLLLFCMENSGRISADPASPPDLSHPNFLNNNDDRDFDHNKVENGGMGVS